jgi:cytochrome c-type biogenesis protein CcmH/NrfF
MLFGLTPGDLLLCIGPAFVVILIVVILLVRTNRRAGRDDDSF